MATLVLGNRIYSSWSLRGWLLVRQAGLAVEEIVIPLRTPETGSQIRQHSPSGKVPTLVVGDLTVWDSLAIAEFCAEQAPDAGLWPADAAARAVARSVSAEMHAGFQALRGAWPMNLKRQGPALAPDAAVVADIARISAIWADCRARFGTCSSTGGPFLFGDWCAADAMFAPVVSRFVSYVAPLDPQATAYCTAVMNHPLMREWSELATAETWAISDIDAL
ncbi:MAG: glutathione S-transferase family protein [Minwuia sp.]|nr:glutathione S-transferase family protein [Minwuia sp.]